MIDTGAEISVIPRKFAREIKERSICVLATANGTDIRTYSIMHIRLKIGLRRGVFWSFVVADIAKLIIGIDLLANLIYWWMYEFGIVKPDLEQSWTRNRKSTLSIDNTWKNSLPQVTPSIPRDNSTRGREYAN